MGHPPLDTRLSLSGGPTVTMLAFVRDTIEQRTLLDGDAHCQFVHG